MQSRGIRHCVACGESLDALLPSKIPSTAMGQLGYSLSAPPVGSGIQIVQATDDHLVLTIPPGGKRGCSLGCFAIAWLGITAAVSSGFVFAALQPNGPPWPIFLFLSIFWLIGLGMLYFSIKLRFTRGYLFLEPQRAVLQTILFGRKRITETALDANSVARLQVSYQENGVNVYRVEVVGSDTTLNFGTAWDEPAKEWYCAAIQAFLDFHYHPESFPPPGASEGQGGVVRDDGTGTIDRADRQQCLACGETLWNAASDLSPGPATSLACPACGCALLMKAGRIAAAIPRRAISPDALPPESVLRVDKQSSGDWVLSYRLRDEHKLSSVGCLVAFGVIWISIPLTVLFVFLQVGGAMSVFATLFCLAFSIPGLLVMGLGLFARFGRVKVTLGGERASIRWGLGPIAYTRRFQTAAVNGLRLIRGAYAAVKQSGTFRETDAGFPLKELRCTMEVAGASLPVTFGQNPNLSRAAAGAIRYALDDLGIRIPHE